MLAHFKGLPTSRCDARSMVWVGDFARFIVANLR